MKITGDYFKHKRDKMAHSVCTKLEMMSLTGIILAGGNSSRMGADKGLVQLKGRHMIEHVADVAGTVCDEIIIIAGNSEYRQLGYTVYSDIIKNSGPLGGIYTGLTHSNSENNLVVSCDIPFITRNMLKFIIKNSRDSEITIPIYHGKSEPLCGLYHKNCILIIREFLLKKEFKLLEALKNFNTKKVDIASCKKFSEKLFRNINTPEDLMEAEKII